MNGAIVEVEEPPPKRVRNCFSNHEPGCSDFGTFMCNLPIELSMYILKLAVVPAPGRMTMRKALAEYTTSWQTLASLRLVRKRSGRLNDGLNAIFYQATLQLWMQLERVRFANDKRITNEEVWRIQDRDADTFRAIHSACGRNNASWKRALTAYKEGKKLPKASYPLAA
jgi:hypothetical protein